MSSHGISKYFEELITSPFSFVFWFITLLTTSWGLVSIYKDVEQWTNSKVAAIVITGIGLLSLLAILGAWLMKKLSWKGLSSGSHRYMLLNVDRKWKIEQSGAAILSQKKTYLFIEEPQDNDLIDVLFGSNELPLNQIGYKSADSNIIKHSTNSDETMRHMYWKPKKGEVKFGKPYEHHTEVMYPFDQIPKYKSTTIPFTIRTLSFTLEIESAFDIKDIVIYKATTPFRSYKNADKIAKKGKTIRFNDAPMATKIDDKNYKWVIEKPKLGATYYMVIYYEGYQH